MLTPALADLVKDTMKDSTLSDQDKQTLAAAIRIAGIFGLNDSIMGLLASGKPIDDSLKALKISSMKLCAVILLPSNFATIVLRPILHKNPSNVFFSLGCLLT
ncbi:hypothetical protein G6M50_16445 [Agrobacterium rhizogenes]|nr:hypothetical protein [Rhizobium rhizogenes]NTJ79376.1 hypothetical protein [Rhizobium rhizogenes]